ncbi:hypothetical protein SLS58_004990 [Diplodia intermedia]|uniref:F-box domain-containing protein n=1 Tax=Diplodia intermedia TaxID=856260 RepID=A0ABR3TSB4_9PEZI
MDIVLIIGEWLDDAALRNLRAVSRDFDHAMYSLFVRSCVAKLRSNPQITIGMPSSTSFSQAEAISGIPAIADAISAVHIRVCIPPSHKPAPLDPQASEAYDKNYNILRRYTAAASKQETPPAPNACTRLLGSLANLRKIRVELLDVPPPARGDPSDLDREDAKSASEDTETLFSDALAAVSTVAEHLQFLQVDNDATISPGILATGNTNVWGKHMSGAMANLTALTLVLPSWGLSTASFGSSEDLHGAVIISQLLRAAPNLEELNLSGTCYACLDPPVTSAIETEMRPGALKVLTLAHFVTTSGTLERIFAAQSPSLRTLALREGALIEGNWETLLYNFPDRIHLHEPHISHLFNLYAASFGCIGFSHDPPPQHAERACEECCKWTEEEILWRDEILNSAMTCLECPGNPYHAEFVPVRFFKKFRAPSYGIQEYASNVFQLHSESATFRAKQKAAFEEGRLKTATDRLQTLSQ